MNYYKNLKVWQSAVDLSVNVYQITEEFPKKEQFTLVSQLNRSAVSIPSNIAEGAGRQSIKEFINFLSIANGSCYELETQLIIANKIGFIKNDVFQTVCEQIVIIEKMIFNLQKSLNKSIDSN
jgi:four helix bundle protein